MSRYAFDDDFKDILDFLPGVVDFSTTEKVQKIRAQRAAMSENPADRDDVEKEDRKVPGREGAPEVPIRIYRPVARSPMPISCVVEIHGGGFMMGSIDTMDPWCQRVAAKVGCVVVSVGYRLAPENPYPAGLDDCYAALCWTATHATELGVDAGRIAIGRNGPAATHA